LHACKGEDESEGLGEKHDDFGSALKVTARGLFGKYGWKSLRGWPPLFKTLKTIVRCRKLSITVKKRKKKCSGVLTNEFEEKRELV
jgi:hypothetical protein